MQVHLLVLSAPLHEHVVPPAAFSIHADLDTVVLQQASELAALVSVEDGRRAVAGDGFLHGVQTKVGGQGIG